MAYQEAALRHGVEPYLLQAVTRQESAFQVRVKSSAGALGLMQVMPATAKLAIRRGGLTAVMGSGSGKAVEQDCLFRSAISKSAATTSPGYCAAIPVFAPGDCCLQRG